MSCLSDDFVFTFFCGAIFTLLLRLYLKTSNEYCKTNSLTFLRHDLSRSIFSIVCLLLTIIVIPILTAVLLLFTLYRAIIYSLLKAMYKNKFGGFMPGGDAIWQIDEQSQNIINSLVIIEERAGMEKNIFETVKQSVINEVKSGYLKDSKIVMKFEKRMGYAYYLKEKYDIENCIGEFDSNDDPHQEHMTHEGLKGALSKLENKPLPYNHSVLMEVLVGKRPIIWKNNDKKKCYAVILRVHHSLGDGVSFIKMLSKSFSFKTLSGDHKKVENHQKFHVDQKEFSKKQRKFEELKRQSKIYTDFLIYLNVTKSFFKFVLFFVTSFLIQMCLKPNDDNPLHGPKLDGEKLFFWMTEDDVHLVPIIRKLKNKIRGAYFIDILLTGLAASLREYFKKKTKDLPKYISAVTPERMRFTDIKNNYQFSNNFSLGSLIMPIKIDDTNENISMIPLLKEMLEQTHIMKDSTGIHANYWTIAIINAVIPLPLLHNMYRFPQYTTFISNLPGPKRFSIFDQLSVRDLVFCLTNMGYVGLGVSCLSYDNRLQISFIVDKALISAGDNLQEILDNIPKYIQRLDWEISGKEILCENYDKLRKYNT